MIREKIVGITLSVFFIFLTIGLLYTQILKFGYYSTLSKNNSIRIIPIDGPRGNIFDRNKTPLVTNRLSFNVAIIYQELKERSALARLLNNTFGMSGKEFTEALEKARFKPYAPVTVLEDMDKDKALILEEASCDIGGLLIETRSKRDYLYNDSGSHIFGYLGEITEDELDVLKDYGYRMKDLVGRDGLEKYYDKYLRGIDGGTQIEVDNRGRQTRVLGLKEPASGRDLYLTMDISLQGLCDKLLGERRGAIIVMNPKNGEILALASHPAFDPNVFVKPKTSNERLKLLKDKIGRPLSNRAISGLYPPGSVFKIVTATAALCYKKINTNTTFSCDGSYHLGNARFDCWKEKGHGPQNILEALKNSCNVFFYNVGRLLKADNLETFAKLFGFGRPTGIDLPDEVNGFVPGRIWKRIHKNDRWYEGETINYSIGQGYLLVTPIQILNMMAVMATRGSLVRPHLVNAIQDTGYVPNTKQKNIGLPNEVTRIVREGLFYVVNSEDGTGRYAKIEGVFAAGKTGTAQNPHGRTHAWFAGFAPYNDPKICLVVFLEFGGKGGLAAAEIAHDIFEEAKKKGYL